MYLTLKTLHIVSSTILFGTGLGTAFFMLMANRSRNRAAITVVTRVVMQADLYFTTPSGFVQPITGVGMVVMAGFPVQFAPMNWLGASIVLYVLAGACWLPVLWLQWRMHRLAAQSRKPQLPVAYWRYERIWAALGVPAFTALVVVFWLMTAKPF